MAEEADKISLNWLDRGMEVICKIVLCITCTAMFAILLANVVLRYIAGSSLAWAGEVPELLFPWFVMAGVVLATIHNAHIYIGFIVDRVRPGIALPLAVLRTVVVAGAYGVLVYVAYDLLEIVADERSPILNVPGSVTYSCLMLGLLLVVISELSLLLKVLAGLRAPHELAAYE
jgi:TRAP-type C4-dicarboxylate transport system permease small subunit